MYDIKDVNKLLDNYDSVLRQVNRELILLRTKNAELQEEIAMLRQQPNPNDTP